MEQSLNAVCESKAPDTDKSCILYCLCSRELRVRSIANDMMNGKAVEEQQGLHIPEHLLQEAATSSHNTGTPRSTGLFDYISRAASNAATILQVRTPCCACHSLQ
jgi:hypothetical protein